MKRSSLNVTYNPIMTIYDNSYIISDGKVMRFQYDSYTKNYKNVINEGKIDTIGSKYSYFLRNGQVNYKEFDIGGIIYSLSDVVQDNIGPQNKGGLDDSLDRKMICDVVELEDIANKRVYEIKVTNSIIKLELIDKDKYKDYKVTNAMIPIVKDTINQGHYNFAISYNKIIAKNITDYDYEYLYTDDFINTFEDKNITLGDNLKLYDEYNIKTHNNSKYDHVYEREYRERILDFLYSDNIKIYKTLTEGCHAVKLTDISLNPEAVMGNLFYTFSAKAVQVDDFDIETLYKKKILTPQLFLSMKKDEVKYKATQLYIKDNDKLYQAYIENGILKLKEATV